MDNCTLVFNKALCEQIAKLRAEGNDPLPGYTIIQSPDSYSIPKPKVHPFVTFIKRRQR